MQIEWGFWDVVVGIIGVILVVVPYFYQRKLKRLGYFIESNIALTNPSVFESHRLSVNYNNQVIDHPYRLAISIYSLGGGSITRDDFDQPLTINSNAKILSATLVETQPTDLEVKLNIEPNKIMINPLLLNSKDMFSLALITDGETTPSVKARAVDVKEIERLGELSIPGKRIRLLKYLLIGLALIGLALIGGLMVYASIVSPSDPDYLINPLNSLLISRLRSSVFAAGFMWGLFVALVVGTASRAVLLAWTPIKYYMTETGPKNFISVLPSCLLRLLLVFLLAFGTIWLYMNFFN